MISFLFNRKSHSRILATNIAQSSNQLVTFAQLNAQDAQCVVTCFFNVCFDFVAALQNSQLASNAFGSHGLAMVKLGYEPIGSNGVDLATAQKVDLARWEKPIKATGVQLD